MEPSTFGQCVGENVRRIRTSLYMSIDALARCLQQAHGEVWTKSRLAALERGGRQTLTEVELYQLATVLGVSVADFYWGDGNLVAGQFTISRAAWRDTMSGQAFRPAMAGDYMAVELALLLGMPRDLIACAAEELYGRTVTLEHVARVADDAGKPTQSAAVHRGQVTRTLAQEIREQISKR